MIIIPDSRVHFEKKGKEKNALVGPPCIITVAGTTARGVAIAIGGVQTTHCATTATVHGVTGVVFWVQRTRL